MPLSRFVPVSHHVRSAGLPLSQMTYSLQKQVHLWHSMGMATDPSDIDLTHKQRRLLARRADESGKGWQEVLEELLGASSSEPGNEVWRESFLAKAMRLGAVGMVRETPRDLLTNPSHFDGFGGD